MNPFRRGVAAFLPLALLLVQSPLTPAADTASGGLTLSFEMPHWLTIRGDRIPGREIRINYLEAYCRPGSTDADWVKHTVIPHQVRVLGMSEDRKTLRLRDELSDGVTVEHVVTAREDEVDFRLRAHNPGKGVSEAHWAQPCVRLGEFTGYDPRGKDLDDYLPKCFLFLGGKLARMSEIQPWAKQARYTPGQTWCPKGVPRTDVNPRPLSPLVPDNGLIGAFSGDDTMLFATAWEPYQELFQGVIRCLHSDLRLGGLAPGETKDIRGKIYVVTNDVPALLARYAKDFPEHAAAAGNASDPGSKPPGGAVSNAGPGTSLTDPAVRFSVPAKPYVVVRQGDLEAVVVDNRAVDDEVLPGHAAGYSGLGALRHARQPRNLFVPRYAGLNFEHIHDGTIQPREVLFEPRHAPMELRVVDATTVELYQKPTPHWGLESCLRYRFLPGNIIETTFEWIPRRDTFRKGYCGLFWASYIDRPESLDIHFRGGPEESPTAPVVWLRGVTPAHGTLATHRGRDDRREFARDPAFPLELPFGFSRLRYAEPWYFGICRGMALVQSFQSRDGVWLSQSPSGGGTGCPAWDFQWHLPQPKVGQLYRLVMRAAYLPLDQPGDLNAVRRQVQDAVTAMGQGWDPDPVPRK